MKVKIYANNLIKKLQKQDGTQSYGCYRRKVNSKAFAIPILTADKAFAIPILTADKAFAIPILTADAVRIGIANAL